MATRSSRSSSIAHFDKLNRAAQPRVVSRAAARGDGAGASRGEGFGHRLCLDLDGFRAINERYGQSIGDKLLVSITQRMSSILRDGDTLARWPRRRRVRRGVAGDFEYRRESCADRAASRSSSRAGGAGGLDRAGFGQRRRHLLSADRRCRRATSCCGQADQAMYSAKLAGQAFVIPCVRPYCSIGVLRGRHEDSATCIRRAMRAANSSCSLPAAGQHVDEARSSALKALVRWRHPELGHAHAGTLSAGDGRQSPHRRVGRLGHLETRWRICSDGAKPVSTFQSASTWMRCNCRSRALSRS